MKNCEEHKILCFRLERYATENYFTIDAIIKVFGEQISGVTVLDTTKSVDEQIGFKEKGRSIKAKNYEIIEHMTLSDLYGTDLLKFANEIKTKLDAHFAVEEPFNI